MTKNNPAFPTNADIERVWRIMNGDPSDIDYDLATSVYYQGAERALQYGSENVWVGVVEAALEWCARFQNQHSKSLTCDEIKELKEQVQWLMQKVKDLEFPGR